MQQKAKVSLSDLELQLVTDETFILTKNQIIQKVYTLFGACSQRFAEQLQQHLLLPVVSALPPKIAKGENYKGLPYVMLDYPRSFGKDDVFAIRCFFWWGHYFSCTLHLKGMYKTQYEQQIINAQQQAQFAGFFIGTGDDEWNHDTRKGYMMLNEMPQHEIEAMPWIKVTAVHSLQEWDHAFAFFEETFQQYLKLLTT